MQGDLKNKSDINEFFARSLKIGKPIQAVIHLAGLKSVFESTVDPLSYWENKLNKNDFVGVIFMGIIIRGETSHYDLVTHETYRSIGSLA